jgi:hypothetical protein
VTTPHAGAGMQGLHHHVCSAILPPMSRGSREWLRNPQIKPERVDMFGHIGRLAFQPAVWPASARRLNFRHADRQCSLLQKLTVTCHANVCCSGLTAAASCACSSMPQFIFVPRQRAGPDRDAASPLTAAAAAAARAPDMAQPEQTTALDVSSSHAAQHQHLMAEQQQQQHQATFIRQLVSSWHGGMEDLPAQIAIYLHVIDVLSRPSDSHDDGHDGNALHRGLQDIQDFALISRQRVTLLPGLNVVSAALVQALLLLLPVNYSAELGDKLSGACCR